MALIGERVSDRGQSGPSYWPFLLSGSLLLAGGIHLSVAVDHLGTSFGAPAFVAAVIQLSLGVGVFGTAPRHACRGIALMSLVLIELYVLNVTIGLPPLIAHSHVPGSHVVLGVVLSRPNSIDIDGIGACLAEAVATTAAVILSRRPSLEHG